MAGWAHRSFAHRAVRLLPLCALASLLGVFALVRAHKSTRSVASPLGPQGSAALVSTSAPEPEIPSADVATYASTLHGDSSRKGRAHGQLPSKAHLLWSFDAGGPIAAQVTTTDDEQTFFVVTLSGRVSAVDRTGRSRWSLELGERIYSSPLVLADRILFGTDADQFVAVSHTGKLLWKFQTDADADTSALGVGSLAVFAAGKRVYALDSAGIVKWRYQTRRKVFSSPSLTTEQQIVFGAQDGHVYALSLTGSELWQTDVGGHVDAAPAGGPEGSVFVGSDAQEVAKLDAKGRLVWKCNVGGYVRGSLTVARNGDIIVGTYGPNPKLVRISSTGTVVKSFGIRGTGAKEFGIHGSALEDDRGRLAFGAQDNLVRVLSPTLAEEWSFSTGGDVDAPLTLLKDGILLVPSEDGKLYALGP